uniref:hypothetical protein n=1 Tax=Flavobacterium sp. TaxID=239 RepID=UPI004049446E
MKNILFCFTLFFLFQNLYSQSVLNFPFLSFPTKKKSASYHLYNEYDGSVIFDRQEYVGKVVFRHDSIIVGNLKINGFNKKLTKLNLKKNNEKSIIERVGDEMYLHRLLKDTLGLKIYDTKIFTSLKEENVDTSSLLLFNEKTYFNFHHSIFRSKKGRIETFLRKSALNKEQELYLRNWLESNI